jgi:hypothetical protein
MQPTILHPPRVAWDGALALIAAARADDATFGWCRDRLGAILGSAAARAFETTRRRVIDPTAAPTEAQLQMGLWRVRLDDAQHGDPNVGRDVHNLTIEVVRRVQH